MLNLIIAPVLCFAAGSKKSGVAADGTKIDLDLTKLSANVVYAQVFSMLVEPELYENKIIRIKGNAYIYNYDDGSGERLIYSCVIQDATACCAQGIEFVLKDSLPYPSQDTQITVVGRFHRYEANGLDYIELIDCVLE